jgi:hypothetical protein
MPAIHSKAIAAIHRPTTVNVLCRPRSASTGTTSSIAGCETSSSVSSDWATGDHGDSDHENAAVVCINDKDSVTTPGWRVTFRHKWQYNVFMAPASAGEIGITLNQRDLPYSVLELTRGLPTPVPAHHLSGGMFSTYADLTTRGNWLMSASIMYGDFDAFTNGSGSVALFLGQIKHGVTAAQMLAIMEIVCGTCVGIAVPQAHREKGNAVHDSKGSYHVRVRRDMASCMLALDRSCFFDEQGVWIASNIGERRQLAVFEALLLHYYNDHRTSLPFHAMTAGIARQQRLGLPTESTRRGRWH